MEYRGEIAGTGTLLGSNIRRVFVAPARQRMGFGRLIMQRLEHKAVSEKVGLLNLSASLLVRDFYGLLGYRIRQEGTLPLGDNLRLKYYEMIKSLDTPPGLQRIL